LPHSDVFGGAIQLPLDLAIGIVSEGTSFLRRFAGLHGRS